jgi:chemotaxis protein MotB
MPPRPGRGVNHGSGRARRHSDAGHHEEGGSERWLVTYADMLTLLLVLFIVLFSISVVNTSKFISLKTSLADAFGNGNKGIVSGGTGLLDNDSTGTGRQLVMPGNPVADPSASGSQSTAADQPSSTATAAGQQIAGGYTQSQLAAQQQDYSAIENSITAALRAAGMAGAAQFQVTTRGLVITVVTDGLVFPGNSAILEAKGQRILAAVAPALGHESRDIEVDGYTNQQNVSTYPYPSGWELSSARASAVVRYLASNGVAEQKLSAVGFSDLHPLYPPSNPLSITLNRRVEIVVLSSLAAAAAVLPVASS